MPEIRISPQAHAALCAWQKATLPNEVGFIGMLTDFTLVDIVPYRQHVGPAHVEADGKGFGDGLFAAEDKWPDAKPLQFACHVHTHPGGMDSPSGTDEEFYSEVRETMPHFCYIILTETGKYWARIDTKIFDRWFSIPCTVAVTAEHRELTDAEQQQLKTLVTVGSMDRPMKTASETKHDGDKTHKNNGAKAGGRFFGPSAFDRWAYDADGNKDDGFEGSDVYAFLSYYFEDPGDDTGDIGKEFESWMGRPATVPEAQMLAVIADACLDFEMDRAASAIAGHHGTPWGD